MVFKKLEIFGFKSFADKTILNFEPGITAVVGPNGCGKSNIFDAIRWVLGEQSIKELRGSSKEDVIFSGTSEKPSLGFAEVSLTLANESRMLDIEYDEVVITRRLFRSGESEYMLNRSVMRLKDIQELLMGTGIGAEAYSLIQQGKVDLVVSAKPDDRRMIFDEASGITKYKTKKREAMNKLKDTENNLLRINDIIVEVKRQIGSIERQANKAKKYKIEYERLKTLEISVARHQIGSIDEHQQKIQDKFDAMKAEESKYLGQIEVLAALLEREGRNLEELEQKINAFHSEAIKLDGQINLNNRQIEFNHERIENLDQNKEKLSVQKTRLIERCRMQQEKVEGLKQALVAVEEAVQVNEGQLNGKKERLEQVEKLICDSRSKITEHEEKTLLLTSAQVNVRNELTDAMKEKQGSLARKRRLDMEQEKVLCEKNEIDQKLNSVDGQINNLQEIIGALEREKAERHQLIDDSKTQLTQLGGQINELEKKGLALKSQKEFIEKLHDQYQHITDPIVEGRLITKTLPMDHHTGILGKVKDVRTIKANALQRLGVTIGASDAEQLYEIVCETKFIELDPQQITARIEEIDTETDALVRQNEGLEQKIRQQRESLGAIDQNIHDSEKKRSGYQAQKKDILAEVQKLSEELELVNAELEEVNETLAGLKIKEEELNYRMDTVNKDIEWCQNDIREQQALIAAQAKEKEEVLVAIAQLETEIESSREKLRSEQEHQSLFTFELDKSLEEIKKIDDEFSTQGNKKETYEQEIETLKSAIEATKAGKDSIVSTLAEHQQQKQELVNNINNTRTESDAQEKRVDEIKRELHGQELEVQKIGFNAQDIKNRLFQTYKIDYDQSVAELIAQAEEIKNEETGEDKPQGEEPSIEALTEELEKLRKKCDSFGNVNLVAIEEYEELKERFEFLTKQQSDLLEAKSQLMSTIRKINRSTREMFMNTFTKVGEEFRVYFRALFGGGEAELILLDPENVLESGIEIVAKPPGKKLQNISLLSGGEKTLTAIALIFAVFKVNPSPFCVLDEIDAALDEANVDRFSTLLKDFAKIAQFIVITHNKKTIANADILYGITMPETGISKVVSVKLSEDEAKEEELVAA